MSILILILYVLAFLFFLFAAFGVAHPRVNLLAAGLACWILAEKLLGAIPGAAAQ